MAKRKRCRGQRAPDRWRFWRPRHVYPSGGTERRSLSASMGAGGRTEVTGVEAAAERYLFLMLPDGNKLYQCGNGRWHRRPPGKAVREICDWGVTPYYDAKVAHEVARRIRYRIPQAWEWVVFGLLGLGEIARLVLS